MQQEVAFVAVQGQLQPRLEMWEESLEVFDHACHGQLLPCPQHLEVQEVSCLAYHHHPVVREASFVGGPPCLEAQATFCVAPCHLLHLAA